MKKAMTSPVGRTVTEGAAGRRARSSAYRTAEARFARAHEIAKMLIHLRTELGLTQQDVAKRAGTSYSQISRIENGRHNVNTETLDRILRSLGARPIFGYEIPAKRGKPARRELVAI